MVTVLGWVCVALAYAAFAAASVVLTVTDLRRHRLPNRVLGLTGLAVGALLAFAAAVGGDWGRFAWALAGGAGYGALLLLLWALAPGALGAGDVKLAPLVGLATGWVGPWAAFLWAPLLTALGAGVAAVVTWRRGRADFAFGPVMLAGGWGGIALELIWG